MINLLPPDLKQEYIYAKFNNTLLTWSFALALVIIGVLIITSIGTIDIKNATNSYKVKSANTQSQLQSQNLNKVKIKVTSISNNLSLMVKVLSQEVLFSQLLNRLATITPSNVILTNLTITENQKAVDLTAQAKDYNSAIQLQANLASPTNLIFAKSDIENISCPTGSLVSNSKYPCTVSIKALFTKNNPYLFINATKSNS